MKHVARVFHVVDGREEPYEKPKSETDRGDPRPREPDPQAKDDREEHGGGLPAPIGDALDVDRRSTPAAARVDVASRELRRKLAWAVGTAYGVKYTNYDTWPAEYARRASERLIEVHGDP